jgi:hypothetical protein
MVRSLWSQATAERDEPEVGNPSLSEWGKIYANILCAPLVPVCKGGDWDQCYL